LTLSLLTIALVSVPPTITSIRIHDSRTRDRWIYILIVRLHGTMRWLMLHPLERLSVTPMILVCEQRLPKIFQPQHTSARLFCGDRGQK
ncbi:MAG: hypothetical protein Q9180_004507, partial [Flavoplaca navasiana]